MLTELLLTAVLAAEPDLRTVAETSDYTATATHSEVMDLLKRLDDVDNERGDVMHLTAMGESVEGRTLPLAVLADPPVSSAAEARATGRPIVFALGNIHAGEVCGKEALCMLARELVTTDDHPLLEEIVILLAPILNADGNERMSPDNRPGQKGPERGMGIRRNAQNLDLNRDWTKLDSPECRSLVALLNEWDPHIVIDLHTTNGSHHRYTLTHEGPTNPAGPRAIIDFTRNELLPTVTKLLRGRTGYDTFFYANFNREHTVWATYGCDARYSVPYIGLRGRIGILSEAHAYAPYKDRVLATREFVRQIMRYAADHDRRVVELCAEASAAIIDAGRSPQPDDTVGLRFDRVPFNEPVIVRGYEMVEDDSGRPRPTAEPRDYRVLHLGRFVPLESVRRPWAYIIEPGIDQVVEKLRQHGIAVEPFRGDATVESYTIEGIQRARREYQGRRRVRLEVEASIRSRSFSEGSIIVHTAQPLGTLAVYLLEPRSVDGLASWNLLDAHVRESGAFPVHRVRADSDLR
jgi:hypothetical protein